MPALASGSEHVTEEVTEFAVETARDSAREAASGLLENAPPTTEFGGDPDEELSRLARLSEENPDLRESIRECELLSHALIAQSSISAGITCRTMEEVDAINRGPEIFAVLRSRLDSNQRNSASAVGTPRNWLEFRGMPVKHPTGAVSVQRMKNS